MSEIFIDLMDQWEFATGFIFAYAEQRDIALPWQKISTIDERSTADTSPREFLNCSIASDAVVPLRAPFRNTGSRCSLAPVSHP